MDSQARWRRFGEYTAATLLFCVAATSQVFAQRGSPDPEFAKVPFESWLAGGEQTQMRWKVSVSRPRLSIHQRLLVRIDVQVDGAELVSRGVKSEVLVFVQMNDEEGLSYQEHGEIDLAKLQAGLRALTLVYTQSAFVTPGDYRISVAVYNKATSEHWVKEEKLHVSPLKNDPMPEAWRDLPRVELRPAAEPPDSWYFPSLKGKLHLPVQTRRPARIDVLVNLTPSERASASLRVQDRNLGALLPALKAISQVEFRNASLNVALLDLARRSVTFQQDKVRELDWPRMKEALAAATPGKIDVKALADRHLKARFFVDEVGRRVLPNKDEATPACALIVLSSSVAFEAGEDLQPIRLASAANCRVYYFRFRWFPMRLYPADPRMGAGGAGLPPPVMAPSRGVQFDELARTLKPLAPRVFDVTTPEEFRKALATALAEIGRM